MYTFLFLIAVALFVYPERVIAWISSFPRKKLPVPPVVTVQVGAMCLIGVWSLLLLAWGARFEWWVGLVWAGVAIVIRAIKSAIESLFGFDKW